MPLLDLPAELLIQIFDYLGPSFFSEDHARLTICKRWNEFASTVLLAHLEFTPNMLQKLMSSPCVKESLASIQASTTSISVTTHGFDEHASLPTTAGLTQKQYERRVGKIQNIMTTWTTRFNANLTHLGVTAKQSAKLRILRMHASHQTDYEFGTPRRRNHIHQSTLQSLLSTNTITYLHLDLRTYLTPYIPNNNDFHVCTRIGEMFGTLQYLQLHTWDVCAYALTPAAQFRDMKLPLRYLKVDLTRATRCGGNGDCTLERMQADILQASRDLVTRMAHRPKVVKVMIDHRRYLDMLTGTVVRMRMGETWDS